MKFSVADFLGKLPLPANETWREGVPFIEAFIHGTMSLELFAPRGEDLQSPHAQDEIYVIAEGTGEFVNNGERTSFKRGDVLFVPAETEHRFENFSDDFVTWVIFYGEKGAPKFEIKSENPPLIIEKQNDICIIRFSRPKERNPLSIALLRELHALLDYLNADEQIKTIIFTGSEDVFASGANLREIADVTGETAREYALRGQTLMQKIAASNKLTIAFVNGFCFGGAFDLALACKRRIATPNAQFCHPGANLGIMTGWSGTQRLPRLIGEAKALEFFLTAKRISAEEALKIGLVDEIGENLLTL